MAPQFTAQMLRIIAEAADGLRNEVVWFVVNTENLKIVAAESSRVKAERKKTELGADTHEILGPCQTKDKRTGRRKIEVLMRKKDSTEDPKHPDSDLDGLFWSEAAVEKFVLPYYISIYGIEGVEALWDMFDHDDVAALGHLPKSEITNEVEDLTAAPSLRVFGWVAERAELEEFTIEQAFQRFLPTSAVRPIARETEDREL
jgi:hypothetical protein